MLRQPLPPVKRPKKVETVIPARKAVAPARSEDGRQSLRGGMRVMGRETSAGMVASAKRGKVLAC